LGGDDFFKLLIAQLTNQDPLQPTTNQELLQQISSIREIELSTTLTHSLQALGDQQRFGSASTLIGRFVTGTAGDGSSSAVSGTVVGVRFASDGKAVLQLDSGTELPLEQVQNVVSARQAGEALIGRIVNGLDKKDPAHPRPLQGMVVSAQENSSGDVTLELDTGDQLKLKDVLAVQPQENAA
jgi:flagellar basal-body rod modification protein FlgD